MVCVVDRLVAAGVADAGKRSARVGAECIGDGTGAASGVAFDAGRRAGGTAPHAGVGGGTWYRSRCFTDLCAGPIAPPRQRGRESFSAKIFATGRTVGRKRLPTPLPVDGAY